MPPDIMEVHMRLKYFIAGFLAAIILSTGVVAFANPETRQLIFGVNVVVGNRDLELDGIDRPFILDGRTFLPIATIANALNLPIEWDGSTSTVYVGFQSPVVGHWEVIGIGGMAEEEFDAQLEQYGPLEVIFFADGRMDTIEGGRTFPERWHPTPTLVVINNIHHQGFEVSEPYLTIWHLHEYGNYTIFRRIN